MSEHLGSITAADNDRHIGAEPRIVSIEETSMNVIIQLIQKNREEDQLERSRTQADIADLKSALSSLHNPSPMSSHDSPIINRGPTNRRTSMFFGSPILNSAENTCKPTVQVLQHDIVYDTELKVSSLAGLQYLSKQRQILSTKYPNHQISLARMVSYNLRQHVLAAYNHLWYKDSDITGSESQEILVEDWLSLSNAEVQAILVEAARPRTREMCARELILFLGKDIPQSPPVNPDNFSKLFYGPMVKSLTDLQQLCSLLSADTSPYSNNMSKIPVPGYGTKDSPGQIQIWVISLGSQKDSILNWLGKDVLVRQKNLESAVKYIRSKFMEGRHHSELRQDFDAKLTPIRYDDLRSTQGESYNRQQTPTSIRQPFTSNDSSKFRHQSQSLHDPAKYRQQLSRSTLNNMDFPTADAHLDHSFPFDDDNDDDMTHMYADASEDPIALNNIPSNMDSSFNSTTNIPNNPFDDQSTNDDLGALTLTDTRNNVRQAIAATYQGYCSELFVLGVCPRKQSGCPFDHSAQALERCIRSFTLLSKRELHLHGQLPPWSQNTKDTTHTRATSSSNQPDGPPTFNRTRDQHTLARNPVSFPQSRPYNK